jgi:hypothetical protein
LVNGKLSNGFEYNSSHTVVAVFINGVKQQQQQAQQPQVQQRQQASNSGCADRCQIQNDSCMRQADQTGGQALGNAVLSGLGYGDVTSAVGQGVDADNMKSACSSDYSTCMTYCQ